MHQHTAGLMFPLTNTSSLFLETEHEEHLMCHYSKLHL